MEIVFESDDLDLYISKGLTNMVEYKWDNIALKWHTIGFVFHFIYILLIAWYVQIIYIRYPYVDDEIYSDESMSYHHR